MVAVLMGAIGVAGTIGIGPGRQLQFAWRRFDPDLAMQIPDRGDDPVLQLVDRRRRPGHEFLIRVPASDIAAGHAGRRLHSIKYQSFKLGITGPWPGQRGKSIGVRHHCEMPDPPG